MKRQIVHIDREKCNGCGACAKACHESAIGMVDGKAMLLRDDYCDGMGDCLPACPTGAITFEEREAAAYDEKAVMENKAAKQAANAAGEAQTDAQTHAFQNAALAHHPGGGCPGSRMRVLNPDAAADFRSAASPSAAMPSMAMTSAMPQLRNWPVQIKLAPVSAPYFDGAKLLIAADCTAYAYASFHQDFIRGKVTLIGCPKLDAIDYSEKLTAIIRNNNIQSVQIVRMEVPCCGGLENAAKKAIMNSGKFLPWSVVTISIDGKILD